MNYDTVLPEKIVRRYRRRRLRVPHWIKRSLVPAGVGLIGLAIIYLLALVVPLKPDPRLREITQKALARVGVTPPQVSATLPAEDDHWNNVCTP